METQHKRSAFSGKLGFVLSAAGASVGLGNIWRFPYLAAKYGGGIFLLIYILLAVTFGYTMIIAETALGRMTRKSPVGAYSHFGKGKGLAFGGWINAIIPILIVPYYSVIGGWITKYFTLYLVSSGDAAAQDGFAGPCGRFDGHGDLLLFVHAQHGFPVFRLARRDLRPFKPRRRTHERHGKSRSGGLYHRHNCRYLHVCFFPAFQHGQRRQHQPA